MMEKPDIQKITQLAPEASNIEEIGSGGFKVVYKALVKIQIEAVKLVLDKKSRDDHIQPLLEGLRLFEEKAEL